LEISASAHQRISASAHQRISASAHQRISASAHQRINKTLLILFLIFSVPCLNGQNTPPLINIESNPTAQYMSGYLNGIDRNHYYGNIDHVKGAIPGLDDGSFRENMFGEKLALYENIQERFAQNGRTLYRLGHDVTDGPNNSSIYGGYVFPGWHWATDYKSGFNREAWFSQTYPAMSAQNSTPSSCDPPSYIGPCDQVNPINARLGAGIHRFLFTEETIVPTANNVCNMVKEQFSGFTVNVNYSRGFDFQKVPKSRTIYATGAVIPDLSNEFTVVANGKKIVPEWISGGVGLFKTEGNYLLQYRFTYKDDTGVEQVNFYGFVISISNPANSKRVFRAQPDLLLWIDETQPTVLGRHSVQANGLLLPRLTSSSNPSFSEISEEEGSIQNIPPNLTPACQEASVGYDNLKYALDERKKLNADLAVVINVDSGSPDEAVGLLEYLISIGEPIAYVELGSELIGNWNNSTTSSFNPFTNLPLADLGKLLKRFAIRIRQNPTTSHLKIALTSTFDYKCSFSLGVSPIVPGNNQPPLSSIASNMATLVGQLHDGSNCLFDYINIHNYPNKTLIDRAFNASKAQSLLGLNQAMATKYLPEVNIGLKYDQICEGRKFIFTESNTYAADGSQQVNYFTEGMYFAESFATAIDLNAASLTPFAFMKEFGAYNVNPNFDPSDDASTMEGERPFNLLFYFNNELITPNYLAQTGSKKVFAKPVFMLKRMLAENIGENVVKHTLKEGAFSLTAFLEYDQGNQTTNNYPSVHIVTTRTKDSVYTLIINRDLYQPQTMRLSVDNDLVSSAQIMTMHALFDQKKPFKTIQGAQGGTTNSVNLDYPQFIPLAINQANQSFAIQPFSVNIIRSAAPKAPDCVDILSPQNGVQNLQLNGNILTWSLSQSASAYRVLVGTTQTDFDIMNQVTSGLSISLPVLPLCSDLYIRVLPIVNSTVQGICPSIKIRTTCTPAPPTPPCTQIVSPQNGTVLSIWNSNQTISWTAVQNISNYLVTVTGGSQVITFIAAPAATSYTLTDLQPCTQYVVTIVPTLAGVSAIGCTTSTFATACPPGCASILTPALNAVGVPQGTLITWSPITGATGYNVRITSNGVTIDNLIGNTTQYTLPPQIPCSQIQISAVPYNNAGYALNCQPISIKMSCCTNCEDITVNTTTTWPAVVGYYGGSLNRLIVKAPATLTIGTNSTLEFCSTGTLIVEPGASVIMNGVLTSCDNEWQGVDVRIGGSNAQGGLLRGTFTGNGTPTGVVPQRGRIENARIAVYTRNSAVNFYSNFTFKNNRIGIKVDPYVSFLGNPSDFKSVGSLTNSCFGCTFDLSADYKVSQPFDAHVDISTSLNTHLFINSKFRNNLPDIVNSLTNFGIRSSYSSVILGGDNQFENLTYGIHSGQNHNQWGKPMLNGAKMNVNGATFTRCAVGIFERFASKSIWTNNTFKMGDIAPPYLNLFCTDPAVPDEDEPEYATQIGIDCENNVLWSALHNNHFFGRGFGGVPNGGNVKNTIGTNMVNIGSNLNVVYRNEFRGLDFANLAEGTNGTVFNPNAPQAQQQGLFYECNTLSNNIEFDIQGVNFAQPITLKPQQGRLSANGFTPAGNCFSNPIFHAKNQFFFEDDALRVVYHHAGNATNCIAEPTEIFGVSNVKSTNLNLCPTSPPTIGGEPNANPPQGITWTPENTIANRAAFFDAFGLRQKSVDDQSKSYYTALVHETARKGYLSAMAENEPFDSVLLWLTRMETATSLVIKAQLEYENGLTDAALSTLASISEQFELSVSQHADIQQIPTVWELQRALNSENQEVITALSTIAENEGTQSSALARNTLAGFGVHFAPILQIQPTVGERNESSFRQMYPISLMRILPNPARDLVLIELPICNSTGCRIRLFNSLGQLFGDYEIANGATQFVLSVAQLQAGLYRAVYTQDGQLIETQSFTVAKD
jgi:hypothetical protein